MYLARALIMYPLRTYCLLTYYVPAACLLSTFYAQLFKSPGELELRARSALARSQLAAGELHNESMLQRGRAAVPGPGAGAVPRNVAFLKLHKTSGTSTAYDLFRSLQLRADEEVGLTLAL